MPRPTRVLWLIKGLGPGGAERLLVSAAQARDRDFFHYEAAYLLPWKAHLVPLLEDVGVPVTCLNAADERDLRWAARLRGLLVKSRYDVVHVHSPYVAGLARLVVKTLPRFLRPAVVSTEHNVWSSFAAPTRLLNAWTSRLDSARLAVSEDVRQSMAKRLREGVEVVVHGVPLDEVRAARSGRRAMRQALGIEDGVVLAGTVANYRPQKAYDDLLHAAQHVLKSSAPVRFVAVGQGPLEEQIKRLHSDLGLGARFQLLGYRADAVAVMAACDLFVLASRHEGLPVALMEAQVLGLPVVATAVGGVPEAVTHGIHGILVAPNEPRRLAEGINQLVGDPERRSRMSQAAEESGLQFDIRHATGRVEHIYQRVAGRLPTTASND